MHMPGSLLVIDMVRAGTFPARPLAVALGLAEAEVVHSLEQAVRLLTERQLPPSYVVIDTGAQGQEALDALARLMRACAPGTRVIAAGTVNDVAFYRALKQLGVWEYLVHPVDVGALARLLQEQPVPERVEMGAPKSGKVISFMSAASGDGASTCALNVAYALATEHRAPTVLVDMDYQFGMMARQLDLPVQFGIKELFEHPERGVDATLLRNMLLSYGGTLNILAAPGNLRLLPGIRPETVRELIQVLKREFAFVLIDVPHVWMPWTAEALLQADRVVAVGQLWLRSLTHLSRLMTAWGEMGLENERVLLALNRVGAKYREAITAQDFERVILKSINFYLANDIRAVVAADNQGKTIIETGNSQLERQLRDMARVIYALRTGGVHPEAHMLPPKNRLRALFGG